MSIVCSIGWARNGGDDGADAHDPDERGDRAEDRIELLVILHAVLHPHRLVIGGVELVAVGKDRDGARLGALRNFDTGTVQCEADLVQFVLSIEYPLRCAERNGTQIKTTYYKLNYLCVEICVRKWDFLFMECFGEQ